LQKKSLSGSIPDLLPSADPLATIYCRISEANMDDAHSTIKYDALSYVWGVLSGISSIMCDGKTLKVTENCLEALRHLRGRYKPRTLWVDAICIDQKKDKDSTRERNQQVKLMGEVYVKAARVLVWLGPAEPSTARTFRRLALVGRLLTLDWKKNVSLSILRAVRMYLGKSLLRMSSCKHTYNTCSVGSKADFAQLQALHLRASNLRPWPRLYLTPGG
jgi:hypothetical protein